MAAEFQPDAITLDLLRKPIHGLEVLQRLKDDPLTSKIPVIVVTIADQPTVGSAVCADEYLLKPVDKATLLAAVERCLHSRGRAAPTRAILVVEDDVSTREMIVELLTVHGYAVNTAGDGAEARASVARSLPELVILDLVLPKMSGFDLLAEWRANPRTAEVSVFVLTSKDLSKEEEKYVRMHAESLFQKQNFVAGTVNQTIGARGGLHADAGGGCLKQRRILVVEDNELNRELLRDWLEVEGYEVRLAAGCKACLAKPINFQELREQLNHWLQERTVARLNS
jgi:CheY-like chemotaxis protein